MEEILASVDLAEFERTIAKDSSYVKGTPRYHALQWEWFRRHDPTFEFPRPKGSTVREELIQKAGSPAEVMRLIIGVKDDQLPELGFLEYMTDDWSYLHDPKFRRDHPLYASLHYWLLEYDPRYAEIVGSAFSGTRLDPGERKRRFEEVAVNAGRMPTIEENFLQKGGK